MADFEELLQLEISMPYLTHSFYKYRKLVWTIKSDKPDFQNVFYLPSQSN